MQSAFNAEIKDFDVIHTNEARGFHNICVWHYARKYGVPYVFQAHGTLPTALEQQSRAFVLAKHASDILANRRIIRDAAKVIASTQSEASLYEQLGVERTNVKIIPNGIDTSLFKELPVRGKFRARYNIASNERLILFLGRIHKVKGLELLLTAFSGLKREVDDVKLVIAGPDFGYLARVWEDINHFGITDCTVLPGPLYEDAKLEAYVDADVFVLPSSYESFGITAIEACACGTPTIVTNRCGVADAIARVGCVIDYDTDQLQSALHTVLTNVELRERMKRQGPTMVRERYDMEKIVDDIEELYRTCV
jgi:glycosyltransferase involved in cell wall biosynthesis